MIKDEYIKLEEIAEINSGLFTRRIESKNYNKSFKYFTIPNKALNDNYINQWEFETLYVDKKIPDKYIAHYNDIVIKLSPPHNVAIIDFKKENIVVPLNCGLIRLKSEVEFSPLFLSYILNSDETKKQLLRLVEGSGIKIMKINQVKDIKIKKIPFETQKKYEDLLILLKDKKKLLNEKLELEELFTKDIINNINKRGDIMNNQKTEYKETTIQNEPKKSDLNVKLDNIKKMINNNDITRISKSTREWGGADVMIRKHLPEHLEKTSEPHVYMRRDGFYNPTDKVVVTDYSKELSWLFKRLRDSFTDQIDYMSKYFFYDKLAQSAIDYLEENKDNVELKSLLLSVLDTARKMVN